MPLKPVWPGLAALGRGGRARETRTRSEQSAFVTVNDGHATSFGNAADSYDRVRPGPAAAAVDWLVPADCDLVVDLAAGTGLFTRALLGRAARVVAE